MKNREIILNWLKRKETTVVCSFSKRDFRLFTGDF